MNSAPSLTVALSNKGSTKGAIHGDSQLARILADICRQGALERRREGEHHLLDYVECEARDLSGEPFTRFMTFLYDRIYSLITSSVAQERLGGVLAIDELIDVKLLGEDAAKTTHFARYLREVFHPTTEPVTMEVAAATLGHLVRSGGAPTADIVETEVRRAIDWLGDKGEARRYAAALILRELAENAPAVFNVHVRAFIDAIWNGLRDPKQLVREASVAALRACLVLVEKRETRYRVMWYYRLFEETQRGLTRYPNSLEHIHGSLLALGELLRHTGEFMLARYREVVEIVLRFRESKEKQIQHAVISLIPRLAAFAPERFAATYLNTCVDYLINIVKTPAKRGPGFTALGDMALALADVGCAEEMRKVGPRMAEQIREAISAQRGRKGVFCPEALQCVGVLSKALGNSWKGSAASLIEPMILTGLSSTLVQSLQSIVEALPELLGTIQAQLLDLLSLVLAGRPYRDSIHPSHLAAYHAAVTHGELQGAALTRLALQTLGSFDFGSMRLLDFVRDHVTLFLDDPDVSVRRAAAAAAAKVLHRAANIPPGSHGSISQTQTHIRVVEAVVGRLLMAACADGSIAVRRAILYSVQEPSSLDMYLAQADALQALFVALNDEAGSVRALAISVIGRLAGLNPGYILPAARKHLIQLLNDMEHSPDSRQRQESAHLLGRLIKACPRLVLPYVSPILKALVAKLRITPQLQITVATATAPNKAVLVQGGGESGVVASVLATTGELARVAGPGLRTHIGDVLPLIIEAIQDSAGGNKRLTAVSTLGQVVESTGLVMTPYLEYPQLLSVLLRMLNEGEGSVHIRREVLKVLGIVGALDPHTHKTNQADLQGEGKLEREGVRPQRQPQNADGQPGNSIGAVPKDDLGGDLLNSSGLVTSSEEYYPTVAINALMRALRDPAMASHHAQVVRSLFSIFQDLKLAAVPFLPKVMSALLGVLRGADEGLQEFLIQQVTLLVALLKAHMRKWLADILDVIGSFWSVTSPLLPHLLRLLSELAVALRDDMRTYLPNLLPRFMALFGEAERGGGYELVRPALACLEALGSALEGHLPLLLPALTRLINPSVSGTPIEIRRAALHNMQRLLPKMQLAGYAAAILHPLMRVLDGHIDELRRDAADTICAVAVALGPDFALFVPSIRRVMMRHKKTHDKFAKMAARISMAEPPCMSNAEDWESQNGWVDEMGPPPEPDTIVPILLGEAMNGGTGQQAVNPVALRRAWESSQRSTKEDWAEWMRHFSVELLKESPSPALRATHTLAQVQPAMARDLFPAGFVSCWSELDEGLQEALIRSLEAALASPSIPKDIVTTLLNLAEFMEHDEKSLPLDSRTLGALAEKCHAFAKALHYKELEYATSADTAVEALISINNQLRQPEAAIGILTLAQTQLHMELKESWYEKLNRWDEALEAYERKYRNAHGSAAYVDAALGRMRCLHALAEWERLSEACRYEWGRLEPHMHQQMAHLGANAAWHMGHWDEMATYVGSIESEEGPELSTGSFLSAVLNVRHGNYTAARVCIERSRDLLGQELAALVGESYERAYQNMVRVQQLTELEETIDYSLSYQLAQGDEAAAEARRVLTREMWQDRLRGVQRNHEVWQSLLSVRSLVLPMHQDTHTWLKFASLCRKSARPRQAQRTLRQLLGYDPAKVPAGQPGYGSGSGAPDIMFGFLKHMWATHSRQDALARLEDLGREVTVNPLPSSDEAEAAQESIPSGAPSGAAMSMLFGTAQGRLVGGYKATLVARVHMRLGNWRKTVMPKENVPEEVIEQVKTNLHIAIYTAPDWSKAWHSWALFNAQMLEYYARTDQERAQRHVAPAVAGFFKSVALGQANQMPGETARGSNLQDILRLLTLWFTHGSAPDVERALEEGFGHISIDIWLVIIPQVIARIHHGQFVVRRLINSLLICIGRAHPQALMYPLLVACKSQSSLRRLAAKEVVDSVRSHSPTLVEQAQLVSTELIRMAILWHEMWHEALEEASRQYFGESNVEAMLKTLMPLHEMMARNGPTTLKEIAFVQAYGRELQEAYEWCERYKQSRRDAELHQAWDLYYHVFKRINKQLPSLTILELQYVAPALVRAQGLELAVPGTYIAGEPVVTIAAFAPQLHVITSKQRPRKLTIHGSDGAEYMFLLKGHEDLRQDERVMQLFGLVNTMLAHDRITAERDLSIARYAVIPLSPNSGLIGWVPNTDTLHALIREYRDARKIPLNVEHRLMLGMAPDYENLTVIQKVEVFEHALESTSGEDLHRVLWLKSRSSEVWLERRTHYTRSCAVMSMVGYLLGLGDRHPSNLMLDRYSGKLLHIDFGDCFEASMHREKFPERVPFRLTRMMINAMEVSGVEGNFRSTCENVVRVLRMNKDSVMAMLEAFVHDPLINWRLLNTAEADADNALATANTSETHKPVRSAEPGSARMPSPPRRDTRERELLSAYGQLGDANEILNERAVAVMKRMSDKLTGRDFLQDGLLGNTESDSVQSQVQRLILQACSHENLCQSYIGWCPFW